MKKLLKKLGSSKNELDVIEVMVDFYELTGKIFCGNQKSYRYFGSADEIYNEIKKIVTFRWQRGAYYNLQFKELENAVAHEKQYKRLNELSG